jgi:ribosomal protein S27AE
MENKKWCPRCHGGVLATTLEPKEMKCNLCGYSRYEIDLADYIKSKGYIAP